MLMFEFFGGAKALSLILTSNLSATRTGGAITFTVTAYGGSTVYSGAAITFYKINSDSSITSIGSGTSNASGIVTLAYTISGTDTPQRFYAYFAGNTTWSGNSSNIVSISVEPDVAFGYFNTGYVGASGYGQVWEVPANVYNISVLAIGPGGASTPTGVSTTQKGGGGGAIAWYNNFPVTPGTVIAISVSPSNSNKGALAQVSLNYTNEIIVKAEGGWQGEFGDTGSANWVGQYGGRGGQGGTGYITTTGGALTNYWPIGGGGGAAGGKGNNPYYTGTGTNVGFNGPSSTVGPGGTNPSYTITGFPTNQQPNGGSASNWSAANLTFTSAGGNGGGWTVSTTGVMAIGANPSTLTPTIYGWGAGGTGTAWRSDFPPSPTKLGGSGFVQIMWGNNPAPHTFPNG